MKKVLLFTVLVLALTGSLFAGGADEGPVVASTGEMAEETYGMVVFLKGSEFFNWCFAGMTDAAKAIGPHVQVELQGPAEWPDHTGSELHRRWRYIQIGRRWRDAGPDLTRR